MSFDTIDPDARVFFEGMARDCLTAADLVRYAVTSENDFSPQTLSPAARDLGERLFREHGAEFNELLVAAGFGVAQGVSAHLAGATWISNEGRPVMLVAATDLGGDLCDDYMLDFLEVYEDYREQFDQEERSSQ